MKKCMQIAGILLGIIFFIAFFAPIPVGGILNSGNMAGLAFSVLLVLYAVFCLRVHRMLCALWAYKAGKAGLCAAAALFLAAASFTVYTFGCMVHATGKTPAGTETVVVLGCQVREDGPSLMLWERIDAAYAYLQENGEAVCILSGGQGADEPMSEAECMRRALVEKGIDSARLIKEEASTSTRENLQFSKEIIKEKNLNPKVAIVTNNFHMYRAGEIARELDMEYEAIPAKTMLALLPTYALREVLGVLYEIIV